MRVDLEIVQADDLRRIGEIQVSGEGSVAAEKDAILVFPEDALRDRVQHRPQHLLRPVQVLLGATSGGLVAHAYRTAVPELAYADIDAGNADLEFGPARALLVGQLILSRAKARFDDPHTPVE